MREEEGEGGREDQENKKRSGDSEQAWQGGMEKQTEI